jgi:two-component system sensor histidine kinase AlgZ
MEAGGAQTQRDVDVVNKCKGVIGTDARRETSGAMSSRSPARPAPALDDAPASRAETAAPTPRQVVPNGCNLGVMLRVMVAANVGALVAAAAQGGTPQAIAAQFLRLAAVLEPATLFSLAGWCLLRRGLPAAGLRVQRVAAWVVPAAAAAGSSLLVNAGQHLGNPWLAATAGVIGLASGVAAQHYFELRERAFSPVVAEARFQALQSRIRPHFFFNSLNAVLAILRTDPRRAEHMLEAIGELFRAFMGDVRKLVPFEQELQLCRSYVDIEQLRLGERLHVHWEVGAVHPKVRVPQLLLQPIIENAIRYGAERVAGRCEIVVRVRQHGFKLEIFVSNPIAREPLQREGNQMGLSNIRGRLALIYDLEAQLETRARRDRFELTLTLPVDK